MASPSPFFFIIWREAITFSVFPPHMDRVMHPHLPCSDVPMSNETQTANGQRRSYSRCCRRAKTQAHHPGVPEHTTCFCPNKNTSLLIQNHLGVIWLPFFFF